MSESTACLACGDAIFPHVDECLTCEASVGPPRRTQCYRVTRAGGAIVAALARLLPEDPGLAEWVASKPPFDVVLVDATELEHGALVRLLDGATYDLLPPNALRLPDQLRWRSDRTFAPKAGATAAIAVGSIALGTATVLLASLAMGAVLMARNVSFVPRAGVVPRERADAVLDVLDPPLRAAYRGARRALGAGSAREALDAYVALVAEARAASRAAGRTFLDADAERLDRRLGEVACRLCSAAAAAAASSASEPAVRALVTDAERTVRHALALIARPREALASLGRQ